MKCSRLWWLASDRDTTSSMELEMGEKSGRSDKLMSDYDSFIREFPSGWWLYLRSWYPCYLEWFQVWWIYVADENCWAFWWSKNTRLALAKMLLEKPNLLVLDEPTNHLDIETIAWLENYLVNYSGALIIVSHDRYFLDKVATVTLDLTKHSLIVM